MANPDLNIEILGINFRSQSAANPQVTANRALPWLQDTAQAGVWNSWKVTYRDVRILDSRNHLAGVFNLTSSDLADPVNREALKTLLLQTARSVDSDKDGLPDDWERRQFGALSSKGDEDTDGDGIPNFSEFAFGTDPASAGSAPLLQGSFPLDGGFVVTFRRRTGALVDYRVEASNDLKNWSSVTVRLLDPPRNLFDGTGTSRTAFLFSPALQGGQFGFVRVKASPRAPGS